MAPGLILQHERSGPPLRFADWLHARDIAHEVRLVSEQGHPPAATDYPWICSLGSDETPGVPGPSWVRLELEFLGDAIESGTPVLGLCFGGQALAAAAGARVVAADPPQVDWMEIESEDEERIPRGPWLHFHYFQFHLPSGARQLAASPAGPAAFELGPHLALQFHPETTRVVADRWATAEAGTLLRLGIEPADLAEAGGRADPLAAAAAERLFDAWWRHIGAPG